MLDRLKQWAKALKNEITALFYVSKEGPSLGVKILIGITLAYALSPIDLIPDFIPVLGYLDDLIILPVLIYLSIRLIPKDLMDKARVKAQYQPIKLKKNWLMAVLIIVFWLLIILGILV
ncbi:DUF1232 domain-containing protein [Acidaminobacter sp. JC074]|uniref:YkvA family protein n=1 Tax=Acidaminobacter sp. JC074 TaxID=2530199 RepID=UPI001F10436E|nr:DUF1232 domain-containing protein [Acidaminobacter sp. JC074]MCH4886959.1 DUF1232 domain-containing protein [Acidaminobacter sp. JC074]